MKRITFGKRKLHKPMSSYEVGILGVESINEINYGNIHNIPITAYKVGFNDGSHVIINDTLKAVDDL